jgi:hypothetical protein
MVPNLPLHPTSGAAAGTGSELLCAPLAAERQGVNATGLRTALWRCDLGVELPLLAELRHSNGGIYAVTTGYSPSRNTSVERSVSSFTAASAVGDSAH